jgi:TPP-dependent pyruvate/acetoin dehydrogenase alpha subunit
VSISTVSVSSEHEHWSVDQQIDLYRQMKLMRRFDEVVLELRRVDEIDGVVHPYFGEEAVAAGVCAHLRPTDGLTSTHRGHGHCLAKGASPDRMMAELFGRSTGYCGGKGGSMHVADFNVGMLGANGIVAAGLPIATGAALASSIKGEDTVAVCMFGDGAAGAGPFHESLNIASLWRLPIIFVCENNGWASGNSAEETFAPDSVAALAGAYGVATETVDGNDVFDVSAAARRSVDRARRGEGPSLIEARTFRLAGHAYRTAPFAEFRDPTLVRSWQERDPILRLSDHLRRQHDVSGDRLAAADAAVEAELSAAVEFARNSPFPDPADAFEDVFAS